MMTDYASSLEEAVPEAPPARTESEPLGLAEPGMYVRPFGWPYVTWLAFASLATVALLLTAGGPGEMSVALIGLGSWLYVVVVAVHVALKYAVQRKAADWLSPDMLFLLFFGMYHFGYALPFSLGMVPFSDQVFFAPEYANASVIFSALCGILFLLGYELIGVVRGRQFAVQPVAPMTDLAIMVGKVIFAVGVAMNFVGALIVGLENVSSSAYLAQAQLEHVDLRIFGMGQLISFIGLFVYLLGSFQVTGRFTAGVLYPLLILLYLGMHFLSGRRAAFFIAAMPFILAYNYFRKAVKLRYMVAGVLVAMYLMAVISIARGIGVFSLGAMMEAAQHVQQPLLRASVETGGSLLTVNASMMIMPQDQPFWYGQSYLSAAEQVIPNVLPQMRTDVYSPPVWITATMMRNYRYGSGSGLGSSIAMEGYVNFGLLGAFTLFFIGLFHRLLYDGVLAKPTFLRRAVLCTAAVYLCVWTRNFSGTYVRTVVWTALICWVVQRISTRTSAEPLPTEG